MGEKGGWAGTTCTTTSCHSGWRRAHASMMVDNERTGLGENPFSLGYAASRLISPDGGAGLAVMGLRCVHVNYKLIDIALIW